MNPVDRTIRVSLVEDVPELRQALREVLMAAPGIELVGDWGSGEEAVASMPAVRPRVVLMDIHLPGMSGVECVRRLKPAMPDTEFMMVSVFEDHALVYEALKAGATGYLVKKTRPEALIEAIRDLDAGGAPMSSSIARKVVAAFSAERPDDGRSEAEKLSMREREVLERLSAGRRYKEIAMDLGLSVHTVRTHLHHIYEKLQVRSKAEAIRRHRERGSASGID
ncbi:MAG: response regulator transcription factor [Verrucomicrobiae bacterium]|nr:response regulator transcription factor [Verrucomicrobiae bacterium]